MSILEITVIDNRIGWLGDIRHYKQLIDDSHTDVLVNSIFNKIASYETPVSVKLDGKVIYTRETKP